jgi:hypothetical protein
MQAKLKFGSAGPLRSVWPVGLSSGSDAKVALSTPDDNAVMQH